MKKKLVLSPVAFTLGVLSVQPNTSLSLANLHRKVERVFRSSCDLQAAFVLDLQTHAEPAGKLIYITGNPEVPDTCMLRLCHSLTISVSYFADMADSFTLGVLARHYSPLVQVSEVRQRVELLWRFPVVRTQFYQQIDDLIQSGLVVNCDRTADTDQKYLSLRDDALLLEELLATR